MAKAVFHQNFNYSRRQRNVGWGIEASEEPQTLPEEVIAAGVATRVSPRKAKTATKGQEVGAT